MFFKPVVQDGPENDRQCLPVFQNASKRTGIGTLLKCAGADKKETKPLKSLVGTCVLVLGQGQNQFRIANRPSMVRTGTRNRRTTPDYDGSRLTTCRARTAARPEREGSPPFVWSRIALRLPLVSASSLVFTATTTTTTTCLFRRRQRQFSAPNRRPYTLRAAASLSTPASPVHSHRQRRQIGV